MTFTQDQQQNFVYSNHAVKMSLKLSFRNSFFIVGGVFWLSQINGHSPKYSESHVLCCLYVSLCLKNVPFLHSFYKRKQVGKTGLNLQFVVVVVSLYDSRLTFLFSVGAKRPAYLSKPEEFTLQPCLIEGGILLPPDFKVFPPTVRCESL